MEIKIKRNTLEEVIKAHSIPVEKLLGNQTCWVLERPEKIESYIVHTQQKILPCEIDDYMILLQGPQLNKAQTNFLQELVFNPGSYYNGVPIFRRLPHKPGFTLRCLRENEVLDLMIDLHNPGWDFCCGSEQYSSWNWVGDHLATLAKDLFPELASPYRNSVWKKGALKELIAKAG